MSTAQPGTLKNFKGIALGEIVNISNFIASMRRKKKHCFIAIPKRNRKFTNQKFNSFLFQSNLSELIVCFLHNMIRAPQNHP